MNAIGAGNYRNRIASLVSRKIQNDGNRELSYFNIDDLIKLIGKGKKKRK